MRRSKFAAAWWSFTILCQCRSVHGLPELAVLALAVALENGDCWILRSAVSAEPLASTHIHLSNCPVTLIAESQSFPLTGYGGIVNRARFTWPAAALAPFSHFLIMRCGRSESERPNILAWACSTSYLMGWTHAGSEERCTTASGRSLRISLATVLQWLISDTCCRVSWNSPQTGVLGETRWINGRYYDTVVMGVLADEYRRARVQK